MDPDAIAILLFTSGTTGAPKAAVLRHKHLVSYILGSVEFGGAGEDEAALVSVPPYHIAGMAAIAELGLLGPAHRAAPELRGRGLARDCARASASPTPSSCRRCSARIVDALEARARRRPARTCARSPTAAARCRCR